MMVDTATGALAFTSDLRQCYFTAATLSMSSNSRLTHLLPDKHSAIVLAGSFFVNVRMVTA